MLEVLGNVATDLCHRALGRATGPSELSIMEKALVLAPTERFFSLLMHVAHPAITRRGDLWTLCGREIATTGTFTLLRQPNEIERKNGARNGFQSWPLVRGQMGRLTLNRPDGGRIEMRRDQYTIMCDIFDRDDRRLNQMVFNRNGKDVTKSFLGQPVRISTPGLNATSSELVI